eukprot:407533-Rhodomonas_salina.2
MDTAATQTKSTAYRVAAQPKPSTSTKNHDKPIPLPHITMTLHMTLVLSHVSRGRGRGIRVRQVRGGRRVGGEEAWSEEVAAVAGYERSVPSVQ